jgi:hypothetical protein
MNIEEYAGSISGVICPLEMMERVGSLKNIKYHTPINDAPC